MVNGRLSITSLFAGKTAKNHSNGNVFKAVFKISGANGKNGAIKFGERVGIIETVGVGDFVGSENFVNNPFATLMVFLFDNSAFTAGQKFLISAGVFIRNVFSELKVRNDAVGNLINLNIISHKKSLL